MEVNLLDDAERSLRDCLELVQALYTSSHRDVVETQKLLKELQRRMHTP